MARNAAWKDAIDARVASGEQLGLSYLQGLASQYGVSYDKIVGFVNKEGYTLGTKAAAAAQPAATTPTVDATNRLPISDVGTLADYLKIQGGQGTQNMSPALFRADAEDIPGYRTLADYMGVKNINSRSEINRALNILGGANSDLARAQSAKAGINNYNSLNDYLQVLGGAAGRPAAAAPVVPVATPSQTLPTPNAPTRSITAAEAILSGVDKMLAEMQNQDAMAAAAAAQRAELDRQAQRTLASNIARSQMMPNLQIQPATGVTKTGGTQGFRRRNDQFDLTTGGALGTVISGLSQALPATINI